jgi:polysaccharide biosynthesis/export protein
MTKLRTAGMLVLTFVLVAVSKAEQHSQRTNSDSQSSLPTVSRSSLKGRAISEVQKLQPTPEDPPYLIGPEDVLDISVWKEPDFSRAVPVRPDGKISLPLLNDIQASGSTPLQLAGLISSMLRKYVTQPQVTVIVTQINSKRIYIIGEVNHPGPISMLPGMTVLQALSSSGGFTQFANEKGIYILRKEDGREVRYPFNYKDAIRGQSLDRNIVLKPGDTIVVP